MGQQQIENCKNKLRHYWVNRYSCTCVWCLKEYETISVVTFGKVMKDHTSWNKLVRPSFDLLSLILKHPSKFQLSSAQILWQIILSHRAPAFESFISQAGQFDVYVLILHTIQLSGLPGYYVRITPGVGIVPRTGLRKTPHPRSFGRMLFSNTTSAIAWNELLQAATSILEFRCCCGCLPLLPIMPPDTVIARI